MYQRRRRKMSIECVFFQDTNPPLLFFPEPSFLNNEIISEFKITKWYFIQHWIIIFVGRPVVTLTLLQRI